MHIKEERKIRRKLKIFQHAKEINNVSKSCRYWGISRDTFYRWKRNYEKYGEKALINKKPCPENPNIRVSNTIAKLSLTY